LKVCHVLTCSTVFGQNRNFQLLALTQPRRQQKTELLRGALNAPMPSVETLF
jgi:hypothetical protein